MKKLFVFFTLLFAVISASAVEYYYYLDGYDGRAERTGPALLHGLWLLHALPARGEYPVQLFTL